MPFCRPARRLWQLARVVLALLAMPLATSPLGATVLQELGFEELVDGSQLIFVGEVLQHEVEAADGLVYTQVRFRLDELVSGEAPGREFNLRFVGGSVPGAEVEVMGQFIPAVGSRAVWFVSDPWNPLVNPLTGWHQGAFPLQLDADGETWLDLSARPDLLLDNMQADPLARKMLQVGFDEARIAAKVSDYQRFPLADFLDAIRSRSGQQP